MPSECQRSSVRTFRRNSPASSSFVRNSERSGSELDMVITYAPYCAYRLTSADIDWGKIFKNPGGLSLP